MASLAIPKVDYYILKIKMEMLSSSSPPNNAICIIDFLGREITITLDNNDRIIKLQESC